MEKSERNDKEEEDHENSSGRHALTSVLCEAQHSFWTSVFCKWPHGYIWTAQSAAVTGRAAVLPSLPSVSIHQLQHLPALHTAQTTLLPCRSAKGSPLHTNKYQAGSPLVLGYQGWGCRGEVSVTACNEICREPFTVAAVVYCRKSSDVGSVQTNPAAGHEDRKVVQGKDMSVSSCCGCSI